MIQHEQSIIHIYFDYHSLSSNDRAQHVFIEHLRGERLADAVCDETAIKSLNSVTENTLNSQSRSTFSEIILSCKGYAIRRRQQSSKITDKHHFFF